MKNCPLFLAALLIAIFQQSAYSGIGVTVNNGNFSDPAHWLQGFVPGPGDTAIINHETYNTPSVSFKRLEYNSGVFGPTTTTITVTHEFLWTAGNIHVNYINEGAMVIQGPNDRQIQGDLTNDGTIQWLSASIGVAQKTFINNGTFFANAAGKSFGAVLNATFINNGLISVGSGGIVSITPTIFLNNNDIAVNTGTLAIGGTVTNSDTIGISNGAILRVNSFPSNLILDTGSGLIGAGTLQVDGLITPNISQDVFPKLFINFGTVNASGTGSLHCMNDVTWTNGFIQRPVTVAANKNLSITQSLSMGLNSTLTNNGTATWSVGSIQFNNGSLVNNGTFHVSGNVHFQLIGTSSFVNNGTTNFTQSGTATVGVSSENTGTLNVLNGTVVFGSTFANSGTDSVDAGALMQINGTSTWLPGTTLTGNGTLRINNSMTINAPITVNPFLELLGGSHAGTGSLAIEGNGIWTFGVIAIPVNINPSMTLTVSSPSTKVLNNTSMLNQGNFIYNGSGLSLQGTATLQNDGTMNIEGTSPILGGTGTTTFLNDGILNFNQTNNGTINSSLTNNGIIQVNDGTAIASNVFTNNGTIDIATSKVFLINAPTNFNTGSMLQGAGTLRTQNTLTLNTSVTADCLFEVVSGGTLAGSGSMVINNGMAWKGGNINANLTINPGKTLTTQDPSSKNLNNATLLNHGTLIYNGSGWNLTGTAVLHNKGHLMTIATITLGGSATTLVQNEGIIFNDNTGVFTINPSFINSATGVVKGIGTINFNNNFTNNGTVAPGASPGHLTLNKLINSILEIEIAGLAGGGIASGHDSLRVNGTTTLGGTLMVKFVNGFAPQLDQSFTFITTSGTYTGTFTNISFDPPLLPGATGDLTYGSNFVKVTFNGICPTLFADTDLDGFGNPNAMQQICIDVPGFVANNADCNDMDAAIFPGAPEICNGFDDNCDGNAEAPTNIWTGAGDNLHWSDSANWTDGIVPLPCQDVFIPTGNQVTIVPGFSAFGKTLEVALGASLTVAQTGTLDVEN